MPAVEEGGTSKVRLVPEEEVALEQEQEQDSRNSDEYEQFVWRLIAFI